MWPENNLSSGVSLNELHELLHAIKRNYCKRYIVKSYEINKSLQNGWILKNPVLEKIAYTVHIHRFRVFTLSSSWEEELHECWEEHLHLQSLLHPEACSTPRRSLQREWYDGARYGFSCYHGRRFRQVLGFRHTDTLGPQRGKPGRLLPSLSHIFHSWGNARHDPRGTEDPPWLKTKQIWFQARGHGLLLLLFLCLLFLKGSRESSKRLSFRYILVHYLSDTV